MPVLWLVTALMSCEGGTTYSKIVDNQSSETLTILIFQSVFHQDTVFQIDPGQRQTLFLDDQLGRFSGDTYHCTQEIDSAKVSVSNGKMLLKDIMNSDHWTRESKGGRNAKEICTFTVTKKTSSKNTHLLGKT